MAEDPEKTNGSTTATRAELRALANSVLLERMQFMRQAGITFGGARDEYEILGYDRIITNKQYRDEYARGGIAGRIVDALPNATWRGSMELIEDEDPDTLTAFERAWQDLDTRLQIQAKLLRVDKLAGLSTYAVLLIGAPGELKTKLPDGKPEDLLYLSPFSGGGGPGGAHKTRAEASMDADCTIAEYDVNPASARFGLPLFYHLKRTDINTSIDARPVHWTRILHVAENLLDDDVFGQPALERVWNLLCDLRKVTGGGAEAFWLRANQGMHIDVDKDMKAPEATFAIEKLKEQAEEYQHQLTRWLRTQGTKVDVLGSDVANFESPADAVLTQIAGAKAIPKRILTGSEMGELASSQDRDNWKDQINGRQTGYAGPYLVRPLVDRLIAYGYLPAPVKGAREYEVRWPQITTMTEQEKVDGAKGWASVNQTAGEVVFTGSEIREKWADKAPLTDEQQAEIAAENQKKVEQQQAMMEATTEPEEEDKEKPARFPRAAMNPNHDPETGQFSSAPDSGGSGGRTWTKESREARVKELDQEIRRASVGRNTPREIKQRMKTIAPLVAEQEEHQNALDPSRYQAIAASAVLVKRDDGSYVVRHDGAPIGLLDPVQYAGFKTVNRGQQMVSREGFNAKYDDAIVNSQGTRKEGLEAIARAHSKKLRTAETSNDEELIRVLQAAIEHDVPEVIDAILGTHRAAVVGDDTSSESPDA